MKTIVHMEDFTGEAPEDDCSSCYAHSKASETLDSDHFACPWCSTPQPWGSVNYYSDMTTVSHDNTDAPQPLVKRPVMECSACGKHIALQPDRVIWNANHDIWYTGGPTYITGRIDYWSDEAKSQVEQFVRRVKAGERLDASHLRMWLGYAFDHGIAKWLYDRGYKR